MTTKPTVEQALLFKRLSQTEWFGVRDDIIKQSLEATGWNEEKAREYMDSHFIPPPLDHWCPRWSFLGDQQVEGDNFLAGRVRWYLVSKIDNENGRIVVPLDENLEPTNITGRKMSEYYELHADGSHGETKYMEESTDGTEGYSYKTFVEAENALEKHPEKFGTVFIQCPNGQRLKKEMVANEVA